MEAWRIGNCGSSVQPANDNALGEFLESDAAQSASFETIGALARLAKCRPLTALQLATLQHVIESA